MISYAPLEFYLHGCGLEKEDRPDEPVEISFDAAILGRSQIEDGGRKGRWARSSCWRVREVI